jgi:hypothetical protein
MMMTRKTLLNILGLFSLLPVFAGQNVSDAKPTLEIRGKVVELGGDQGISGVNVTIERYAGAIASSFDERAIVGSSSTSSAGAFAASLAAPGRYRITVAKEGYGRPGGSFSPTNWSTADISVSAEKPLANVRFVLARPGEISGSVADRETDKALAGIRVVAWEWGYVRGRAWLMPGGEAVTDAEGRFKIPSLAPADYVIAIEPQIRDAGALKHNSALQGEAQLLTEFSPKDAETADYDYDLSYWPIGAGLKDAMPIQLRSGSSVDMGTLAVSKIPKHRARVSFIGDKCLQDERSALFITTTALPVMAKRVGSVACGQEVLIRGLASGSYQLEAEGGSKTSGSISFTVDNKNLEITMPLSRGVDLDGRISVPEDSSLPDLKGMKVVLAPLYRAVQNEQGVPDTAGRFAIHHVLPREFEVEIFGTPKTHYVKELRYNGRHLAENAFAVDGSAPMQLIEILLGQHPAAVSGTVTDDGKPVSQSYVVLVRWPANSRDPFLSASGRETDESGRFQFAGLGPGEYRILAVPGDDKAKLQRPYVLNQLLGDSEKCSLGEGQAQSLSLKLVR